MAYMALYRKYRPQTFDEVIGQDFATRILKNQIKNDRVGHAYLFTGIRGTGKTTIAKIFARAINCPNNEDGNPCGVCEVCRNIEKPGVMDIIEIDAASNRGVDEIRDIKEQVKYPPTLGKYKVYIIDEVHMLTREAFNALLKTLEEPPEHVVFILATTEPNKLPMTILSRCQRFDIRPISQEAIADRMRAILMDIDVKMDEEALQFIAARGDHSMRDALSILDQIIDIGEPGEPIHYNQVLDFLGMADTQIIESLTDGLIRQDAQTVLTQLKTLQREGKDSSLILDQLITCVRQLIVVGMTGEQAMTLLGIGRPVYERYLALAKQAGKKHLFAMIDVLIEDQQKLRYNDMAGIVLEMCLLRICALGVLDETKATTPRPAQRRQADRQKAAPRPRRTAQPAKEQKPGQQRINHPKSSARQSEPRPQPEKEAAAKRQKHPAPGKIARSPDQLYQMIFAELTRAGKPFLRNVFEKGTFAQTGENSYALRFSGKNAATHVAMMQQERHEIEKLASQFAGRPVAVAIEAVQKNQKPYEAMRFDEKTRAIAGKVPIEVHAKKDE